MIVHPLIQVARGHITDENWKAAEEVLGRAVDAAKDLEAEVERLREALEWIYAEPEDALKVQMWALAALKGSRLASDEEPVYRDKRGAEVHQTDPWDRVAFDEGDR
jgi:hypothetical protein